MIGTTDTFAIFSPISKFLLSIAMIAGRLKSTRCYFSLCHALGQTLKKKFLRISKNFFLVLSEIVSKWSPFPISSFSSRWLFRLKWSGTGSKPVLLHGWQTKNSDKPHQNPFQTMPFNRLDHIVWTGRTIATGRWKEGVKKALIETNKADRTFLHYFSSLSLQRVCNWLISFYWDGGIHQDEVQKRLDFQIGSGTIYPPRGQRLQTSSWLGDCVLHGWSIGQPSDSFLDLPLESHRLPAWIFCHQWSHPRVKGRKFSLLANPFTRLQHKPYQSHYAGGSFHP